MAESTTTTVPEESVEEVEAAATAAAAEHPSDDAGDPILPGTVVDGDGTVAATNDANRHPLQASWTLWYLTPDKSKDWDERMLKLMTFDTVEDFWACYHHVRLPSQLQMGSDYMLFKTGIMPKWEDEQNCKGGKWAMETDKKGRAFLDSSWLETLLAVIGEGFGDCGDLVNGVVVQVRRKVDRLQIWTASYEDEKLTLSIGRQYKSILKLDDQRGRVLQYQRHSDSLSKHGSTTRHILSV